MKKNKRVLGLSALVGLGLMVGGSANAYNMTIGGFDVQVDTTTSFGLSVLTTDTNMKFVPTANGGPADITTYIKPDAVAPFALCSTGGLSAANVAYGTFCQEATGGEVYNFDGAINTDDGRLSFNSSGDMISAPLKLTTDFLATQGNITAFARVNAFYDAVLMDDNSFKRAGISGGLSDRGENSAGYDLQLLDAYVSWDVDVADRPLMVRIGKQVINWGEATFIPGGNSAFNPIDVGAIRRPGAEIKEALLPVEAVYASLALTDDITVEAYYGGWDEYKLDTGGTAFAGSDAFVQGSKGGNEDEYWIGGGGFSGQRFPCGTLPGSMAVTTALQTAFKAAASIDCSNTGMEVLSSVTQNAENARRLNNDHTSITNGDDVEGDEAIGLAIRWYAENLNSTEFAFYYQKMDSRLPYVSYRTSAPKVTWGTTGPTSSTIGRGVNLIGCAANMVANMTAPALAATYAGKIYSAGYESITAADPNGLVAASNAVANTATGRGALKAYRDGYIDTLVPAGTLTAAQATALKAVPVALSAPTGTIASMQEAACLTQALQNDPTQTLGSAFDAFGQQPTGALNLGPTWELSLHAEFPEVETYGMSFNTTIAGWGVQGDFTYRPDVPLQIDTDVLTIAALFNTCAFATVGAVEATYLGGSTYHKEFGGLGCQQSSYIKGYVDTHDAITWDIGTTATFTQSNPIVSALGASLGVFLTEFQGLVVDGIEDDRANTGALGAAGISPLVNTCTSGSDLPLNGILSIDSRKSTSNTGAQPDGYCRPTDVSGGMVLMGQLQYNNVLGTPITVKPTVIISHGLEGNSPSPIGFWRQGVGSTALSFNFEYLSKWQASLAYRAYHGPEIRTKDTDRDHVSVSVSYAF